MSTELNSEFTHFESVIRLSKEQQFALPFISRFMSPAVPAVLGFPVECIFTDESCAKLQKHLFSQQPLKIQTSCHDTVNRQAHDFQVWSLLLFWLFGEVNTCCAPNSLELESRFMPIGARIDYGPGVA